MESEADERFILFLIESLLRNLLLWVYVSYFYNILLEMPISFLIGLRQWRVRLMRDLFCI